MTQSVALRFLGRGTQPHAPDGGAGPAAAGLYMTTASAFLPGSAIVLSVLDCTLLSAGWRDALSNGPA